MLNKFKAAYKIETYKIVITQIFEYKDRIPFDNDYDSKTIIYQFLNKSENLVLKLAEDLRDNFIPDIIDLEGPQILTGVDTMILKGNKLIKRLPYWSLKKDS